MRRRATVSALHRYSFILHPSSFMLLLLLLPAAARAEGPTPQELWREVLAAPKSWELVSVDEPGYRLVAKVKGPKGEGVRRTARIAFEWSEIDTEADTEKWRRPRAVPAGDGVPAAVVVAEDGVYWLAKAPRGGPAVAANGGPALRGRVGMVPRTLGKGSIYCFADPDAVRKKPVPAELCLAPGAGVVAARGVVGAHPKVLFAARGWGEAH